MSRVWQFLEIWHFYPISGSFFLEVDGGNFPNGFKLGTGNDKAKVVLAKGSEWDLFNNVLVNGSWHLDFMHLGLSDSKDGSRSSLKEILFY